MAGGRFKAVDVLFACFFDLTLCFDVERQCAFFRRVIDSQQEVRDFHSRRFAFEDNRIVFNAIISAVSLEWPDDKLIAASFRQGYILGVVAAGPAAVAQQGSKTAIRPIEKAERRIEATAAQAAAARPQLDGHCLAGGRFKAVAVLFACFFNLAFSDDIEYQRALVSGAINIQQEVRGFRYFCGRRLC